MKNLKKIVIIISLIFVLLFVFSGCSYEALFGKYYAEPDMSLGILKDFGDSINKAATGQSLDSQPHFIDKSQREKEPYRYIRDDENVELSDKKIGTEKQLMDSLRFGKRPDIVENSTADWVYKRALEMLDKNITNDMSDIQKVHIIYDWLVYTVEYDNVLLDLYESGGQDPDSNSFKIQGVFVDRVAVCQGIALAFELLCNIENIECQYVVGMAYEDESDITDGIGHAWNKVKVGDDWFIADATWGSASVGYISDSRTSYISYLNHYYLLRSDSDIKSHYETGDYPKAKGVYDYYSQTKIGTNDNTISLTATSEKDIRDILEIAKDNKLKFVEIKIPSHFTDNMIETLLINTGYRGNTKTEVYANYFSLNDVFVFLLTYK